MDVVVLFYPPPLLTSAVFRFRDPVFSIMSLCTLKDEVVHFLGDVDHSILFNTPNLCENGLEDVRLFIWDGLYAIGVAHTRSKNLSTQVLMKIDGLKVVKYWPLQSPFGHSVEKNWVPIVIGKSLFLVYSFHPLIIFEFKNDKLEKVKHDDVGNISYGLRGGSPFIRFSNKYIAIGHYKGFKSEGKFYYRHFFVTMDENLNIEEESEPFFIHKPGVEFACGIYYDKKLDELIISYGRNDRFAVLQKFSSRTIKDMLTGFSQNINAIQ